MFPSDSGGKTSPRRSDYGCCFFLSYARTPQLFADAPSPDFWVARFFRDLCTELVNRDPRWLRDGNGLPGFMDQDILDGSAWRDRLTEHLANCRIFIPLYSRYYFTRPHCGKEWAIFRERQMAHVALTGQANEAIVPVLWLPPQPEEIPDVAAAVRLAPLQVDSRYLERGLYDLIRAGPEKDYIDVVVRLAEYLDRMATSIAPPVGPKADYDAARPLFGEQDRDEGGAVQRRLRITVAAACAENVPPGRNPAFYGPRPEDWRPYHPESAESLAARAGKVASGLGYLPVVSVLTPASPELRPAEPGEPRSVHPDGPGLLLVDPWIVRDPVGSGVLAEFDKARKDWVRVLVPWNESDPETVAEEARLRSGLDELLPWSMNELRRYSASVTRDLRTLAQFGHAMPRAVELGWRRYRAVSGPRLEGNFQRRPTLRDGLHQAAVRLGSEPGDPPPAEPQGEPREGASRDDMP